MKTQNILPVGVRSVVGDDEVSDSNSEPVTLATTLSADYDTVGVKMPKGPVTTVHNGITASVTEANCAIIVDCRQFNAIMVEMAVSSIAGGGTWTGVVYGSSDQTAFGPCSSPKDDGTFVAQATPAIAANGTTSYWFRGVQNYVKIVPTLAVGTGTLTVKVTPTNQ